MPKDSVIQAIERLQLRSMLVGVLLAFVAATIVLLLPDESVRQRMPAALFIAFQVALAVFAASQLALVRGRSHAAVHVYNICNLERGVSRMFAPRMKQVMIARERLSSGRLPAVPAAIDAIPETDPELRFQKALLRASMTTRTGGRADLDELRRLYEEVDAPQVKRVTRCDLAIEEARAAMASGSDWLDPLGRAHAELRTLPDTRRRLMRMFDPPSRRRLVFFLVLGGLASVSYVLSRYA